MSVKLREKLLADGRRSLYLDFYEKGRRWYEFLNLYLTKDTAHNRETRRIAEQILAQHQLDRGAEQHGLIAPSKRNLSFLTYFDKTMATKRGSTADVWKSARKYIAAYGGETLRFNQINRQWVAEFREHLLEDCGLHQNSARHYFDKLRTVLRAAENDGIIARNPCKGVKHIEPMETERAYLTLDELRSLAKTPCTYDAIKRAFFFSVYTGLRKSDVVAITREDIHGDQLAVRQEKTGDYIYVDLSPTALEWLGTIPENGPVFRLPTDWTLSKAIATWVADAKIKKHITFHCARHTFATLALTHGVDLYTVSKLLGHRDVKTTQVYAKIVDEKKRAAINALPSVKEQRGVSEDD